MTKIRYKLCPRCRMNMKVLAGQEVCDQCEYEEEQQYQRDQEADILSQMTNQYRD